MGKNVELYERDFFAWTQATAALIRQGKWHDIAPEQLADEVEGIGRQDQLELSQRLAQVLGQLLTWWAQPEERCGRWRSILQGQRRDIAFLLQDSPSLLQQIPALLHKEYPGVREQTLLTTGLMALPQTCPFTAEQVLAEDFWPESVILLESSEPA